MEYEEMQKDKVWQKGLEICKKYWNPEKERCNNCPLYQPCNAMYRGPLYKQISDRYEAIKAKVIEIEGRKV